MICPRRTPFATILLTMADASSKILKQLDDPRLYHKVEGVPIFVPHKRKKRTPAGKVVDVDVTDDDLEEIAEHNNRRVEETGTLAVITLGHRKQGPDVDETKQPPVVGFCKNWRSGRFGPGRLPVLFYDEYVRADDAEDVGRQYPFRSADFYRDRNEISGVAALVRDPELDLGTIVYAGGAKLLCYSREVNMDPTMPPDPAVPSEPPAPAEADDGAERESYERHCASHPYARKHHEKMLSYAMGAAAPAMPGAMNGDLPGGPPPPPVPAPDESAEQFQRRLTADRYQRDVQAARKEAAEARQETLALKYERDLTQLLALGYEFDLSAELVDCRSMTPEQFSRHKDRIEKNYARGPVGDTRRIPIVDTPPMGGEHFGERELDASLAYLREHQGATFTEAREKAKAAKK